MTEGFWELIALRPDDGTRRDDRGRTLLGGAPLRVLRLSDAGARAVDDLLAGGPVGPDPARRRLARRLLDAGIAHPVPLADPGLSTSIVVPVRDHAAELGGLLDAIAATGTRVPVLVVDDGSHDPAAIDRAVAGRARIVRRTTAGGPAAARNHGLREATSDVVVFVDADVVPSAGWLDTLRGHFVDPSVAAVAPRVRGRRADDSVLARYEEHRSPLDLGPLPARVAPRSRVAYVPTACLAIRRSALDEVGPFDEELLVGEDVDLVWRVTGAGHTVRYEPDAVVTHRNRPTWRTLAVQRFRYGTSAAALERRHPRHAPPVALDPWSYAAWALPAAGGLRGAAGGVAVAAGSTAALASKLRGRFDDPVTTALRLGGLGNLWAGRWLAHATTRAWLPAALAAATVSRRARRTLAAAVVVPPLLTWKEEAPDLDPLRWTAASVLDDVAYCAGVWWGCWRHRSFAALLPRTSRVVGLADGPRRTTRHGR